MEKVEKQIKTIFCCRIVMWILAAGFTVYWIYFSFKLYLDSPTGRMDEHLYAGQLRPVFYTCVLISVACVLISFALRHLSDKIKYTSGYNKYSLKEEKE